VKSLIDTQYKRAKDLLKKNKKGLQQLAEILLEKEVIFSEDLEKIYGKRAWVSDEVLPESPKKALASKKAKAVKKPKVEVKPELEEKSAVEEKPETKEKPDNGG
jgi:Peptidase family M41